MLNPARTKTLKKNLKLAYLFLSILLTLCFIGLSASYAEVALVKSPLVWYAQGTGDFALPELVNSEYNLSEFVATAGQIKTICVNYQAVGEVTVEVSADNGLHYYAATNGVPLTENFISGDRIKWRAKALDADSKLNRLVITYSDSLGTTSSFGRPELSGFNYRKEILLKNPGQKTLFNYQLKLKIGENKKTSGVDLHCSGNLREDFIDICFTGADKETPLAFYRESISGQTPQRSADFWVKVPQIPPEGVKIYIYYGNILASDLSNPKDTFDFYDSFDEEEFDLSAWMVKTDPKGSLAIKDGRIKLDAAEIISKDFKFTQGVIEYIVTVQSGFENSLNLRAKTAGSYDNPNLVAYSSAYKGAEQCIAIDEIVKANDAEAGPIAAGGQYNYRLTVNGREITFERLDSATGALQAKVTYQGSTALAGGYLGLKSGGDGSGKNTMVFDAVRARKFSVAGLTIEKSGSEEPVNLPVFTNTTISENGSLVLSDQVTSGEYVSVAVLSASPIRIIIPDWEAQLAEGVSLSAGVSANSGANYKQDCEKGKFYYASKNDFTAGSVLKYRLKFIRPLASMMSEGIRKFSLDFRPGAISVVYPDGKEKLKSGEQCNIQWSALEYESTYGLGIAYSVDGGKNYTQIIKDVLNLGSYDWTVPADASKKARVKIYDKLAPEVFDTSSNYFTITQGLDSAIVPEDSTAVADEWNYELLIKVGDITSSNQEKNDKVCYKNGDIVVIKPAGYKWGSQERENFLIARARLTDQEAKVLVSTQSSELSDTNGRTVKAISLIRKYRFSQKKAGLAEMTAAQLKELFKSKVFSADEIIEEKGR